jgi:gliding motility-associated-like protein
MAYLHGNTTAAYYAWSPAASLQYANTLSPVAAPVSTTAYLLTVQDTFYCPKPVTDTVVVHVISPVIVNAGHDTTIVSGQRLQLLATSSVNTASFIWLPASYLINANIYNPVANFGKSSFTTYTYTVTATTPEGCKGEDSITIYIYKSLPDIFIPSAFTPNGDGLNDIIIPVLAGIQEYDYFSIFNRWGQLVFSTSKQGKGWNGTMNGMEQPAGTYVYVALGKDYTGRIIQKKGTVVLIR